MKSPTLLIGGLGLVVAVGWFAFGGWLSGAKPAPAVSVSKLPPPPPLPAVHAVRPVTAIPPIAGVPVRPVRIHGGMTTIRDGEVVWLWVSEDGHLMTEEEIAGESGGTVSSRMVRGVRVLTGTGVIYGGTRSEQAFVSGMVRASSAEGPVSDRAVSTAPAESPPAAVSGRTDPFATPPGLLASPPGLLASPLDLR